MYNARAIKRFRLNSRKRKQIDITLFDIAEDSEQSLFAGTCNKRIKFAQKTWRIVTRYVPIATFETDFHARWVQE